MYFKIQNTQFLKHSPGSQGEIYWINFLSLLDILRRIMFFQNSSQRVMIWPVGLATHHLLAFLSRFIMIMNLVSKWEANAPKERTCAGSALIFPLSPYLLIQNLNPNLVTFKLSGSLPSEFHSLFGFFLWLQRPFLWPNSKSVWPNYHLFSRNICEPPPIRWPSVLPLHTQTEGSGERGRLLARKIWV